MNRLFEDVLILKTTFFFKTYGKLIEQQKSIYFTPWVIDRQLQRPKKVMDDEVAPCSMIDKVLSSTQ